MDEINVDENITINNETYNIDSNLHFSEKFLNDSRITPSGNGTHVMSTTKPTSGQKWWAAVICGFVFALISSPAAYYATSMVSTSLGGIPLAYSPGPNFFGLLIHTLIFILLIRIILW